MSARPVTGRWFEQLEVGTVVQHATRRVAYGRGTTVNGWLGTSSGVALGGQTVDVLTAPDNGSGQFTTATDTITAANGGWSAHLAAGPAKLCRRPTNPLLHS